MRARMGLNPLRTNLATCPPPRGHRKMDKAANVMCTWTMKTVLMAALVVAAACGGVLLGLGAQVLGQTAANQPERGQRVAHSE